MTAIQVLLVLGRVPMECALLFGLTVRPREKESLGVRTIRFEVLTVKLYPVCIDFDRLLWRRASISGCQLDLIPEILRLGM